MYILSSLIFVKKKNVYRTEKRYGWKRAKKNVLWNANYDREDKGYKNALIYIHVVLNGDLSTNFIGYCSTCSTPSTCQVFSQVISWINYVSTYLKI